MLRSIALILQREENLMRDKGLSFCFALLALIVLMSTAALAVETLQSKSITTEDTDEPPQSTSITLGAADTQQGKVIVAAAGKLTMEDMKGHTQYTHDVAANAEIVCEGKKCGLAGEKMGDMVEVNVDEAGHGHS